MRFLDSVGGFFNNVGQSIAHAAGDGYKAATNDLQHLWNTALKNQKEIDAQRAQVGSWIDSREQDAEHWVDGGRAWLRQHGGVAGQVASDQIGFSEGVVLSFYDAGKGVVQLEDGVMHLTDPLEWFANPGANVDRLKSTGQTVVTLGKIASLTQPVSWIADPQGNTRLAGALWHSAATSFQNDPAKFTGYVAGTVAQIAIPVGDVAGAVGDAGRVAKAANVTNEVTNVTNDVTKAANVTNDVTKAANVTNAAGDAGGVGGLPGDAKAAGGGPLPVTPDPPPAPPTQTTPATQTTSAIQTTSAAQATPTGDGAALPGKKYVNLNGVATQQEKGLGQFLDELAQDDKLGLDNLAQNDQFGTFKRLRGMPEVAGAASPDYHMFTGNIENAELQNPSLKWDLRGDAVIAKGDNIDNIISNAIGSKSGRQADVIFIEIGSNGKSGQITDAAIKAWKVDHVAPMSPSLKRLMVIRNTGGVRQIVLDLRIR